MPSPGSSASKRPAEIVDEAQQPRNAVSLERCETQFAGRVFRVDVGGAVDGEQHPFEDRLRVVLLEAGAVDVRERVGLCLFPEFVEPFPDEVAVLGGGVSDVELGVGGQSRRGEVGRSGEHCGADGMLDDEGFAVQESFGEAPHRDPGLPVGGLRAQPVHQPVCHAVVVVGETGQIPFRGYPAVQPVERMLDAGRVESAVVRRVGLRTDQESHLVVAAEARGDHVEPGRIDVGGGYRRGGSGLELGGGGGEHLVDGVSDPQSLIGSVGGEHRVGAPEVTLQRRWWSDGCGMRRGGGLILMRAGSGGGGEAHRTAPATARIWCMVDSTASRRESHCPGLAKVS